MSPELSPLRAPVGLPKDICAKCIVANQFNQCCMGVQVPGEDAVHSPKGRWLTATVIQRLDIQCLVLLRKPQDELMAGERGRHRFDSFGIVIFKG
jgi:hypothetical protein